MNNIDQPSPNQLRDIYTISRLNREARATLEGHFPLLWVEGEISNLARPRSGHLYLTLKDEFAQVRAAMFRMKANHLHFSPKDGDQVLIRARVSLYENRGDYQLIIEQMEEAGDGALRRAYEQLRQRLEQEGLFGDKRKRPLPATPQTVGIITSPSGAAVRDIISVFRRRFPATRLILYPSAVQGEEAPRKLCAALASAVQRNECDALIIGRGGGSLEDLWAFNDEGLARAIHACPIPVVSAVGHEIDFTIADFVADQRAATPTAAAELLCPDGQQWRNQLQLLLQRLQRGYERHLREHRQQVDFLQRRLVHPGRRLQQQAQRLDELDLRLQRQLDNRLQQHRQQLHSLQQRLQGQSPARTLRQARQQLEQLHARLDKNQQQLRQSKQIRLQHLAHALQAVSPLATLGRGYAIVTDTQDKILHSSHDTQAGQSIKARLAHGQLHCTVQEVIHED